METMNTDTPETDGEWNRLAYQDHPEFERNLADFARKLERERDKLRELHRKAEVERVTEVKPETMNPPNTAPKDGTAFLANMGWPYLVVCMWSGSDQRWVYANPQIGVYDGEWDDAYFENEWEKESALRGWIPMPVPSIINHF
jgi:hypothetical protein